MSKRIKEKIYYSFIITAVIALISLTICLIGNSINELSATTTISTTVSEESTITTIVYITNYGEKYHTVDCQYLHTTCIEISLTEAIKQGYSPCSKCNPPVI